MTEKQHYSYNYHYKEQQQKELMELYKKEKINPLIGSAGVSAVPMAARVSNRVGMEENPQNYLLMHAMGPNVAGVIGSAVAAGVLLALTG